MGSVSAATLYLRAGNTALHRDLALRDEKISPTLSQELIGLRRGRVEDGGDVVAGRLGIVDFNSVRDGSIISRAKRSGGVFDQRVSQGDTDKISRAISIVAPGVDGQSGRRAIGTGRQGIGTVDHVGASAGSTDVEFVTHHVGTGDGDSAIASAKRACFGWGNWNSDIAAGRYGDRSFRAVGHVFVVFACAEWLGMNNCREQCNK